MRLASLIVCKGFLNRCPPEIQQGLINLMPQKEQVDLQKLPLPSPFKQEHLQWELLDHVHFSWIAPYLRTLSENEVRLYLAALSQSQANGLKKVLGFGDHLPHLTSVAKSSFRALLHEQIIQNQTLIPLAFLPEHPLNFLLDLDEKAMVKIIRFLGLHDLSFEMRQIIATAVLKKIFTALSKKEGAYLNRLILHREPLVFKRLFLTKWDGTKESLLKAIEERGLHRLAHALFFGDQSLVWYVSRKLDMHRGTLLLKYDDQPTHARAEAILSDQIQKILNFLNQEESE